MPEFLILDPDGEIVASGGLDERFDFDRIKEAIERTASKRAIVGQAFERLDEGRVARIVSLTGPSERYTAVFVERVGGRGSIEAAVNLYKLTRRETDVLRLLVRNFSTSQIAETLCITSSTVADHIKKLMHKSQCSRRSELFARVYNLDREAALKCEPVSN